MQLRSDVCYRAVASRDARFDGRFFTGVTSTGIYCRPICPAPTPKPENCVWFKSAAAAAEAGFRPCLRCRPEASPWTPDWRGSAATVNRALRLIADGALDDGSVDELAKKLGIGERQLRRLFVRELGAPPITIATTRRVQFAKRLIDETPLPLTQIAFAAGFGSVRRFNTAIRATYGCSGSELRKNRARKTTDGQVALALPYRPPFDWDGLLAFFRPRAIPGVEHVTDTSYARSIRIGDSSGVFRVSHSGHGDRLVLHAPIGLAPHLAELTARVRRLFDLEADPDRIRKDLERDALLREPIRARPGLRVPGAVDGFELAVRAVLGQQISMPAATTLAGRIAAALGTRLDTPAGDITRVFPGPEQLADADLEPLGIITARANAIRRLAAACVAGEPLLDPARELDDVARELTALPGIGPWTAQVIAMRGLGDPDAFPAGDLGVRKALEHAGHSGRPRDVEACAEAWRPWRAYATLWLWTSLAMRKQA